MKARTWIFKAFQRLAAIVVLLALSSQPFIPCLYAEQFQKVGMIVAGTEKATEVQVILNLEEGQMIILNKQSLSQLKAFPYKDIKAAEYSYSKHPRWKSAGAAAIAVGVLALPIFFLKGKKHWLTVRTQTDYAVLHLEKNDYRLILAAFETRSGRKVDILPEEK